MPSTFTPACSFCGLRFANRPLLELHIREDHLQRDHRAEPGHDDSGDPRTPRARAGALSPKHGPGSRPRQTTNEVIAMTVTRRPRRPRPGWAATALRRAIRTIRHVNQELVLASELIFRPPGQPRPRPRADLPAGAPPAPTPEHAERAA